MKGLIRADYYMIKPELGTYLKLLGFFTLFAVFVKAPTYLFTMQFVIAVMLLLSMMAADENGRDAYYQQLPFDAKELVWEKYIRSFVLLSPFILVADVVGLIITLVYGMDLLEFLSQIVLGLAYLFLAIDFVIPVSIKRGASKSRLLCCICVFLPCFAVVNVMSVFIKDVPGINMDWTLTIAMLAITVLAVLFLPLSYHLSVKYYQEKEF